MRTKPTCEFVVFYKNGPITPLFKRTLLLSSFIISRGSSSADIRNSREILNLFDQIETVETEAQKSEANDGQANNHKEASSNPKVREKKKKKENKKLKKKRKSKDSGDFDKIEEIRIVKRAVSAFKRRKRGGGSKEGEKKTEAFKMETVADRVMKMRIQSGGLEKKGSGMFTYTTFIFLSTVFRLLKSG